ncbi:MAG: hypothetical protein VYE73_07900 [Acidobacteriota bacterium]|nr:hypothetical protein [Acidobacteriota bacterium]
MIRLRRALLASTLLATAVEALPSAGCIGGDAPNAGITVERSLRVNGIERSYRLRLPATAGAVPMPLLLHFHGYTGSALLSETTFGRWGPLADREGLIVVYPSSTSFVDPLAPSSPAITSWNDGTCNAQRGVGPRACSDDVDSYPCPPECGECGACDWCSCHDDVAFVEALIDELEATLCIDADRVYATGFSNGGMFVHRLACDLGDRLTAVAPVGGTRARGYGCTPDARLPSILLVGGRRDQSVPVDGSRSADGYFYEPIQDVARTWAGAAECSPGPKQSPSGAGSEPELDCRSYANCDGDVAIGFCTWDGAHDWPEAGDRQFGNELIWRFFLDAPTR